MKCCMGLLIAAVLVATPALAQSAKPAGASSEKVLSASGTVSAVSADSVTVKGKTAEWTFTVDKATVVTAKGGTHKMDAMKADKKPTVITEFVSVGDDVVGEVSRWRHDEARRQRHRSYAAAKK